MGKINTINNQPWWIPNVKVSKYLFCDKINAMPDFLSNHYTQTKYSQKYDGEITHSFHSNDDAYSLLVTDNFIDSVTCHSKFIVQTNIVGKHLSEAIIEIADRFGLDKTKFTCDDQILYEDGVIQMDVDFDDLGIGLTIDLNGDITSVSVLSGDEGNETK